jgi:hypothetical protein
VGHTERIAGHHGREVSGFANPNYPVDLDAVTVVPELRKNCRLSRVTQYR